MHLPVKPFMHCEVWLPECECNWRCPATSASVPFSVHNTATRLRRWNDGCVKYQLRLHASRLVIKWRTNCSVLNEDLPTPLLTSHQLQSSKRLMWEPWCSISSFATEKHYSVLLLCYKMKMNWWKLKVLHYEWKSSELQWFNRNVWVSLLTCSHWKIT